MNNTQYDSEQQCPFCNRAITIEEYKFALNKLEKQIEERYRNEEQKNNKNLIKR